VTWLAIFIVFLLRRAGFELFRLQRDEWFWRSCAWVSDKLRRWGLRAQLHLPLVLIPPGLLVALIGWLLAGRLLGLPYLLLTVGVLIYSEGRGQLRQQVDEYLDFWRVDDALAAGRSARSFAPDAQRLAPKALASLHRFAVDGLLYRSFSNWFAIVFWLALLGPWAALSYRLLHLYLLGKGAYERRNRAAVQSILYYIDWVPARLLGFVFAIVGNFGACTIVWHEQLAVQGRSAPIFLRYCAVAALADGETLACQGVNTGARRVEALVRGSAQIRDVMVLLRRSKVVWWMAILIIGAVL
jgi:AmpE protein